MNNSHTSSGNMGFVGLLTIVFITLKLIGIIHWSWWWVLSPIWISTAICVIVLLVVSAILFLSDRREVSYERQARHTDYPQERQR